MQNLNEFGREVARARGRRKKSTSWLAEKAGCCRQTIESIEAGERTRIQARVRQGIEEALPEVVYGVSHETNP